MGSINADGQFKSLCLQPTEVSVKLPGNKRNKSDFAIVQGNKMFLDPGDSLDLSIRGVYGELDTKIVKNVHGDSGGVRGAAWLS